MKKEVIINVAQYQHFEFCKWVLNEIGFKNIKINMLTRNIKGTYLDGFYVEIKCIKAVKVASSSIRFYIISDSEKIVEALCTLFEGDSIYKSWSDRESERKAKAKQERYDLFHSETKEKEPAKKDWVEGFMLINDLLNELSPSKASKTEKANLKMLKSQTKLNKAKIKDTKHTARCPHCHSTSLSAHKKGFGVGKAITGAGIGAYLLGPIGLLGATAGNKGANNLYITCLKCGHRWKI